MNRRAPGPSRTAPALLLPLLAALGAADARGQTQTTDPYRPWSGQYQAFAFPTGPTYPGMPNQSRLAPGVRTNEFERYFQTPQYEVDLFDRADARALVGDRSAPYYLSNSRRFDNFTQRPGARADVEYWRDRQARDQAYFNALRETDPARRAQKLREVEQWNTRSARQADTRPATNAARGGTGAAANASPARTPAARSATGSASAPAGGNGSASRPGAARTPTPRTNPSGLPPLDATRSRPRPSVLNARPSGLDGLGTPPALGAGAASALGAPITTRRAQGRLSPPLGRPATLPPLAQPPR